MPPSSISLLNMNQQPQQQQQQQSRKEAAVTGEQMWDSKTQQYHAGQDWAVLKHFVEDYSVTTNALGTPKVAQEAAKKAIDICDHYPPANQEPGKSSLVKFIWPEDSSLKNSGSLLLGNGASELIDLITRLAPRGTWKPGPFPTQYKEYERSAKNYGYTLLDSDSTDKANVICLVNPCNPTGEYLSIDEVKSWIDSNVLPGGYVLVDESMQPWHSPEFRQDSLISQREYLADLYKETGISVFVIHSWTKLWCCCGLRLGSVICPTDDHAQQLKSVQVPWSVNLSALAFLDAAANDTEFLELTWKITPEWRKYTVDKIKEMFPNWEFFGREFTSWIWIDTKSVDMAKEAVRLSQLAGVPIRSGTPGYQHHTFIRVAVRDPKLLPKLLSAWKPLAN